MSAKNVSSVLLAWLWLAGVTIALAVTLPHPPPWNWSLERIVMPAAGTVLIAAALALWRFRSRFRPIDIAPFLWTLLLSLPVLTLLNRFLLHIPWIAALVGAVILPWAFGIIPGYHAKTDADADATRTSDASHAV